MDGGKEVRSGHEAMEALLAAVHLRSFQDRESLWACRRPRSRQITMAGILFAKREQEREQERAAAGRANPFDWIPAVSSDDESNPDGAVINPPNRRRNREENPLQSACSAVTSVPRRTRRVTNKGVIRALRFEHLESDDSEGDDETEVTQPLPTRRFSLPTFLPSFADGKGKMKQR